LFYPSFILFVLTYLLIEKKNQGKEIRGPEVSDKELSLKLSRFQHQ